MQWVTNRAVAVAAGGAIVVALFSGCGFVNSAVDCATAGETMAEISGKVTGEEKALRDSTEKLRGQADDIEDKELKQAALDFADQAEAVNSASNGDVAEGAQTDPAELQSSMEDFQSRCTSLGE